MVFKRFFWYVMARVALLLANCIAISWILPIDGLVYLKGSLFLLLIGQVVWLVYFLNRINRRVAYFFDTLHDNNFLVAYDTAYGALPGDELGARMQRVSQKLSDLRLDFEMQNQFFKTITEQVDVGIIAYHSDGSIRFVNQYALKLFRLSVLRRISQLDGVQEGLARFFIDLKPQQHELLELNIQGLRERLSVTCTHYRTRSETFSLVTMQGITHELDRHEAVTWQKTIRVLTHEMINSLSPVASLVQSLQQLVLENRSEFDEAVRVKLDKALHVIGSRSQGLLDFTKQYRSLAFMPAPRLSVIRVKDVLDETITLFGPRFAAERVSFTFGIEPENLVFVADKEQVVQVMINLLKNSFQALSGEGARRISINAFGEGSHVFMAVTDSGCGIAEELCDQVFIPFFTTTEGGSGIGLSMARQVMLQHGGTISLISRLGTGTTVRLAFTAT